MVKYVVLKGQIGTMKNENKVNDQIVAMNVTDLIKRLHKGEMSVIASRPAVGRNRNQPLRIEASVTHPDLKTSDI